MTTKTLAEWIEAGFEKKGGSTLASEREVVVRLIERLKSLDPFPVEDLLAKMSKWKAPAPRKARQAPSKPAPQSDEVGRIVGQLEALLEELKSWTEPDYPGVQNRMKAICGKLKKPVLAKVCKAFTGRGNSKDTVTTLSGYIENALVTRLENRFMFS